MCRAYQERASGNHILPIHASRKPHREASLLVPFFDLAGDRVSDPVWAVGALLLVPAAREAGT